jgi:hypothetical protein
MRAPFGWVKRLLRLGPGQDQVIQIFTPQAAAGRGLATRLALAGATVTGLALAGVVAMGSFVTLMLALGAMYFLVTQVLGVRLDVDPRAFVQRAQQYAQYSRN